MKNRPSHIAASLAVVFIALPLLAFPQEAPAPREPQPDETAHAQQDPKDPVRVLGSRAFRHRDHVIWAEYSRDGKRMFTYERSGRLLAWEAETGKLLETLGHEHWGGITCALSPDGGTLALLDYGTVLLRPIPSGEEKRLREALSGAFSDLAWTPDGARLVVGAGDKGSGGEIVLVDAASAEIVKPIGKPKQGCFAVAISPHGNMIAAGGESSQIDLYDIENSKRIRSIIVEGASRIDALEFSPNGRYLSAGDPTGVVRLWDPTTGRLAAKLGRHAKVQHFSKQAGVWSLDFSPDGALLATAGADSTVRLWDIDKRKVRHVLTPGAAVGGRGLRYLTVAFSPDGRSVAAGGERPVLHTWDVETGKRLVPTTGHEDHVSALAYAPGGQSLASGGGDSAILLWPLPGDEPPQRGMRHRRTVRTITYSPDGKWLASGGDDSMFRLWRMPGGKPHRSFSTVPGSFQGGSSMSSGKSWEYFSTPAAPISGLHFAPSGDEVLFATSDGRTWMASTDGQEPRPVVRKDESSMLGYVGVSVFNGLASNRMDFGASPWERNLAADWVQGVLFVRRSWRRIDWFDLETEDPTAEIRVAPEPAGKDEFDPTGLISLAVSPSGEHLATLTNLGKVALWEVATASVAWDDDPGEEGAGTALAFSPAGLRLAVARGNRPIDLRRAADGQVIESLGGNDTAPLSIAFAPTGDALAAGCEDGLIFIWGLGVRGLTPTSAGPEISEEALRDAWQRLAERDALRAQQALWILGADPDRSLAFIEKNLRIPSKPAPEVVRRWLRELDADEFEVRERAASELGQFVWEFEGLLKQTRDSTTSPEVRFRIKSILEAKRLPIKGSPDMTLRHLRCVRLLRRLPGQRSEALLKKLAVNAPSPMVKKAAAAALHGRSDLPGAAK